MTDVPIPGKQYVTKYGDTLKTIAAQAYGNSESWRSLLRVFTKRFKTQNEYEVQPGEVINIPVQLK